MFMNAETIPSVWPTAKLFYLAPYWIVPAFSYLTNLITTKSWKICCEGFVWLGASVTESCRYRASNARLWRRSQVVGNVCPPTAELIHLCTRPSCQAWSFWSLLLTHPNSARLLFSILFFCIALLTHFVGMHVFQFILLSITISVLCKQLHLFVSTDLYPARASVERAPIIGTV